MSILVRTVAGSGSLSAPADPQPEPDLWPRGQWRPRPRAALVVSSFASPASDPTLADSAILLMRLAELAADDAGRSAVRDRVIEWYLPMAAYVARRYAGRGEPMADLTQVAVIGLIKAVDRFDTRRGVPFASYAFPTIAGELKRHFRDATWSLRVPRSLQELRLNLSAATEDLAQVLRRSPTTVELAAQLGVTSREVLQARGTATAYRPLSVHQRAPDRDELCLTDVQPFTDRGFEAVDNRESLRVMLAALPAREQLVIRMLFYAEMTQSQIAAEIGVSQMQVSRLLARSLSRLHDGILTDTDTDTGAAPGAARGNLRRTATSSTWVRRRGRAVPVDTSLSTTG